jgi:hypothetical protein
MSDTFYQLYQQLSQYRGETEYGRFPPGEFVRRLGNLGLSVPPDIALTFWRTAMRLYSVFGGYQVPAAILRVIPQLLQGHPVAAMCDPWAGLGELLETVRQISHPTTAYGFTRSQEEFDVGRIIAGNAKWKCADPLVALQEINVEFDLVVSVLPFGAKSSVPLNLKSKDGSCVTLQGDLGHLILTAAATRLTGRGIGLFVVTPSFFFPGRNVLQSFPALGLSVDAALALPAGSFAPYTNIPAYLLVVRKRDAEGELPLISPAAPDGSVM